MASSAIIYRNLRERYLECSVCMQEYNEQDKVPRMLPCHHTYCSYCLRSLIKVCSIKCPQCNKKYKIESDDDIGILPKDNTRRDLKCFLEEQQQSNYHTCNSCTLTFPAQIHCKNCKSYLCIDCFKDKHKNNEQQLHTFNDTRDQDFVPNKYNTCFLPDHEKGSLKYFCVSKACEVYLCATCVVTNHREMSDHVVMTMKDSLEKMKSSIRHCLERFQIKENEIKREISNVFDLTTSSDCRNKLEKDRTGQFIKQNNITRRNGSARRHTKLPNAKRTSHCPIKKEFETCTETIYKTKKELEEELTLVKTCTHLLNQIYQINDAIVFYELFTFVKESFSQIFEPIYAADHKMLMENSERCRVEVNETISTEGDKTRIELRITCILEPERVERNDWLYLIYIPLIIVIFSSTLYTWYMKILSDFDMEELYYAGTHIHGTQNLG